MKMRQSDISRLLIITIIYQIMVVIGFLVTLTSIILSFVYEEIFWRIGLIGSSLIAIGIIAASMTILSAIKPKTNNKNCNRDLKEPKSF